MNNDLNSVLKEIFETKSVITADGRSVPLEGGIDMEEGLFLRRLILEARPKRTIEIGCAHGISSLFICDALRQCSPGSIHTIIDPHQSTLYAGVGVAGLKRAGLDNFVLIEKKSQFALPELVAHGNKYDFGLIDGYHTFDGTLIDFCYLNLLSDPGAIIAFDDVGFPPVNRCVRYALNYPAYQLIGNANVSRSTFGRKLLVGCGSLVYGLRYLVGEKPLVETFNQKFLRSDAALGIDGSMVALRKVAEDSRPWNWYSPF